MTTITDYRKEAKELLFAAYTLDPKDVDDHTSRDAIRQWKERVNVALAANAKAGIKEDVADVCYMALDGARFERELRKHGREAITRFVVRYTMGAA